MGGVEQHHSTPIAIEPRKSKRPLRQAFPDIVIRCLTALRERNLPLSQHIAVVNRVSNGSRIGVRKRGTPSESLTLYLTISESTRHDVVTKPIDVQIRQKSAVEIGHNDTS